MVETVDVVVVGLGVGGEALAGRLAEAGLAVVGIEPRLVGGECPYFACVPTKMMVRAANAVAEARRVSRVAGHADVRPDWRPVAHRIRAEATDDWNDQVAVDRLTAKGMRFVRGTGHLVGPGRVAVRTNDGEEHQYQASRAVVLATGTNPSIPPVPGLANTPYWTNREAVTVTDLPASLLVLGGGPIGLEFAQIFARFGVPVEVLEVADRLLPGEEPETSRLIERVFADEGIGVHTGLTIQHIRYDWRGFTVQVAGGELTAGRLLVATGRRADLAGLGVANIGLDPNARYLAVDDHLRVADGVYAIGDVTEHGGFTHMSMYHADIVTRDILGQSGFLADYRAVPRVTFTDPEVGSVGLSESAAYDAGLNVRAGTSDLPSSARGWIHGPGNDGLIKLVVDADRKVLVGATSAGPSGGEVLAVLTLAIHAEVPLDRIESMIPAYPTFHRAIADALANLA